MKMLRDSKALVIGRNGVCLRRNIYRLRPHLPGGVLNRIGCFIWLTACILSTACQTIGGAAKLGNSNKASRNTSIAISSLNSMAPQECPTRSGTVTTVECRNYIVGEWIAESELKCSDFVQQLTAQTASANLGFGFVSGLLSGMSTIFTHLSVVKPLAGAGSIASDARAEYGSDVLAKQTVGAIAGAIRVRRNQERLIIAKDLNQSRDAEGNPLSDEERMALYPLSVAAADVQLFHADCSLSGGLDQLSRSNQIAQAQNDDAVQLKSSSPAKSLSATSSSHDPTESSEADPPSTQGTSSAKTGAETSAKSSTSGRSVLRDQLSRPVIVVQH